MTHKNFSERIISVVSPVVKLFPAWALRYTKKDNPYAKYFLLSHKREMRILSKTPSYRFLRMAEHRWRPETRLKCLKDEKLWKLFVDEIRNSEEFYAAFNNEAARNRAVACKSYTLSDKELVVVCNSDGNFVYQLLKKQPETLTEKVVRKLNNTALCLLFNELVISVNYKMLQQLDLVLYEKSSDSAKDVSKSAMAALNLLMHWDAYCPNLSPKQLIMLPKYMAWVNLADPLVVADKMVDYWLNGCHHEPLKKLALRLAESGCKSAKIARAQDIAAQLPTAQSIALVNTFIEAGIACPRFFRLLRANNLNDLVEWNLKLCCAQYCVRQIPIAEIEELPEELKKQALVALASEENLPQKLFETAAPELKEKLFAIIEENAQVSWFLPRVERKPEDKVVDVLKGMRKISGRVQDMSLTYPCWAEIFAAEGFYDDEHIIKLLQSKNYHAIWKLVQKQGLTHEQYTAMLFGPLSAQAPQFEAYVKK